MGISEVAKEKAQAAVSKANAEIAKRTEQLSQANAQLASTQQAAQDQTRAANSSLEAEIKSLEMQLSDAKDKLTTAQAGADITDTITGPGLVHDATEPLRQSANVSVANAQALVDQITAQISQTKATLQAPPAAPSPEVAEAQAHVDKISAHLAAAETGRDLAEKALAAIDSVTNRT